MDCVLNFFPRTSACFINQSSVIILHPGFDISGREKVGIHRVYKVPRFLSSRPNWGSPPLPHRLGSVAPPPFGSRGETHSLAGEREGGPSSDEGTETLVFYV